MTHDTFRLTTVAAFAEPLPASQLVQRLNENGIRAEVTGEASANIWTENLNDVQVVVRAGDAKRAAIIAAEFVRQESNPTVDWSQVNVGDSSEIANDEANYFADNETGEGKFQFKLSSLLKLQLASVFVAAFVANLAQVGKSASSATFANLLAVAIISIFPAATVFGITRIAGHRHSTPELIFLAGALWLPAFGLIMLVCF